MKALDRYGLIDFKRKARSFYLADDAHDNKDIADMKEALNYIVTWLCELEGLCELDEVEDWEDYERG